MQFLRCQYNLMILGLAGFVILYILRVNLSVAIVAMVGQSRKKNEGNSYVESCPLSELILEEKSSQIGTYHGEIDWNEEIQGKVLASFFYGYSLTNIIGGRLADKFGGKRVFGSGILLTSLLAFFLPAAARHSEISFVIVRLLQGMTEGVTFPAINSLMSSWVQPSNRALFMSRIAGGSIVGTVLTLSFGGILAQSSFGWPSIFYLSGAIGLIYCIVWFNMVTDHPNDHPHILEEERLCLMQDIGKSKSHGEKRSTPWSSILTCRPFIATCIAHGGHNFGFYCLLTELPTYLSTVHHFEVKNNGLVSSIPYILMWVFSVLYANFIHKLTTSKRLSIRNARRISTGISGFAPMILLLCVSLAGCRSLLVVVIISFAVALSSPNQCGVLCTFQDLSPNYAGTIAGISNTFGTIPGFLAPTITGSIIEGQPTISQWSKVFSLTSIIYFVTTCTYLRFMSTEIQPWNDYGG